MLRLAEFPSSSLRVYLKLKPVPPPLRYSATCRVHRNCTALGEERYCDGLSAIASLRLLTSGSNCQNHWTGSLELLSLPSSNLDVSFSRFNVLPAQTYTMVHARSDVKISGDLRIGSCDFCQSGLLEPRGTLLSKAPGYQLTPRILVGMLSLALCFFWPPNVLEFPGLP